MKPAEPNPIRETIRYPVNYGAIDPTKVFFSQLGAQTVPYFKYPGASEVAGCRGESVHCVELPGGIFIAFVLEGLGTRHRVAEALRIAGRGNFFPAIGRGAAAAILNDLGICGAQAAVINMYLGTGANEWFKNKHAIEGIGNGWAGACREVNCMWGGGEIPVCTGTFFGETFDIAGAAWGVMQRPHVPILGQDLAEDDVIVGLGSVCPDNNGLSSCRTLAVILEDGYGTTVDGTKTLGELLLQDTSLYGPLVRAAMVAGIPISYAINVTGHGWAKIMRANKAFHYHIKNVPIPERIFKFLQEQLGLTDKDAYNTFNMGIGFVVIVPRKALLTFISLAAKMGYRPFELGTVQKSDDGKKRVLMPDGIGEYNADVDLQIR